MADGREVAAEVADPVEEAVYPIEVELFGETRQIPVTNFVLPPWSIPDATGPYDFLGLLAAPFTMLPGGYMIIRGQDGTISNVFASATGWGRVAARSNDPMARTYRRMWRHRAR
jgi:hypothetical protein